MKKNEKYRGFVFYTQDYFGAIDVRLMPLDLRMVWVECFFLMDQSPRRGVLLKKNGEPYTFIELAKIINTTAEKVHEAWEYVIQEQVADVDRSTKMLLNRRMFRDENRRKTNAKNGRKGGNPHLVVENKAKNLEDSLNRNGNRSDKAKTEPEPEPEPESKGISSPEGIPKSSIPFATTQGGSNGANGSLKTMSERERAALFTRLWAPVEKYLRSSVVEEVFDEFFAGARILKLDGKYVTLAVQQSLIDRDGGLEDCRQAMMLRIEQSSVELLRDRKLRLVSIEAVCEESLR